MIPIIKLSGHRGYKDKEIENTKDGFLRAIRERLDYVEIDIRKTSDNIPVIFHDRKINRLLNGKGKLKNLPLEKFKSLQYKDGQELLTLDSYFALVKGKIKSILHIKSKGLEHEIIELIKKYSLENDVIIQSAYGKILNRLYSFAPDLNYALYRVFIGNIGKFFGNKIKLHNIIAPISYWFLIKPFRIQYISLDGPFIYDSFVSIMHRKGIKIILGAMQTERYLKYIEKWGIDIINANNPEKIKNILNL